jgi:hypothetical protein
MVGCALNHTIEVPPLVRLPENQEHAKALGVQVSDIAEFNDKLDQISEIDETVIHHLRALSDRINTEASTKNNSVEISQTSEAIQLARVLGISETLELSKKFF